MTGTPASRLQNLIDSGNGSKVRLSFRDMSDIRAVLQERESLVEDLNEQDAKLDEWEKERLSRPPVVQELRADDLLWVHIGVGDLHGDYVQHRIALIAPIKAYGESIALTETMKTAFGGVLEEIIKKGMKNG